MWSDDALERILNNPLSLQISNKIQQQASEEAQRHSNRIAQYNAYLNRICLYTYLNWLNNSFPDEVQTQTTIFPTQESLVEILEVINGCAINLGARRIVIIPCETSDFDCLCVPQEWIDIPSFMGDYYLAITVDLEVGTFESTINVKGFATHRQIKQFASFDENDRTYKLPVDQLIQSLSVIDITWGMQMRAAIPEFPTLTSDETSNLLELFGNKTVISPRLRVDIPFTKWGALLTNDLSRLQLYTNRVGQLAPAITNVNNLNQWFNNIFALGWQSLDTILNQESRFAFNFRQREYAIRNLSVAGVKLIDLEMELGNFAIALLVGIMLETDEQVTVRVQLHPANGDIYLPPNVKLLLLSPSGAILQELSTRIQDNFVQLKRFTCPQGQRFRIRIAIDNFSITEDFVIEPIIAHG